MCLDGVPGIPAEAEGLDRLKALFSVTTADVCLGQTHGPSPQTLKAPEKLISHDLKWNSNYQVLDSSYLNVISLLKIIYTGIFSDTTFSFIFLKTTPQICTIARAGFYLRKWRNKLLYHNGLLRVTTVTQDMSTIVL